MGVIHHVYHLEFAGAAATGRDVGKWRGSTSGRASCSIWRVVSMGTGREIDLGGRDRPWRLAVFLSLAVAGLGFFWIGSTNQKTSLARQIAGTVVVPRGEKGHPGIIAGL